MPYITLDQPGNHTKPSKQTAFSDTEVGRILSARKFYVPSLAPCNEECRQFPDAGGPQLRAIKQSVGD